jgi:para-nitrobenzyl esterase
VYRYRFLWEAPARRACHALDLPFTFGTFDVSTWRDFTGATGARAAAAEALSDRMRTAWASFAATGTPVDPVSGPWASSRYQPLGTDDADEFHDTVAHRTEIWLGHR